MNTAFIIRFKRLVLFILPVLWLLMAFPLSAGVLLTKGRQAEVGILVESETALSLQSQSGAVNFKKDVLLWYALEKEIDTLFKAAQKAQAQGNNQVTMILYELSAAREPATQPQAQAELEGLRAAIIHAMTSGVSVKVAGAEEALSPEEKVMRGQQIIENGKALLERKHIDPKLAAETQKTANQNIADGTKLLEAGQKGLAEIKARQEADAARQKAAQETIAEAKQIYAAMDFSAWSQEDKLVNAGVVSVGGLMVLGLIWVMTVREPKG